jgi:hypothetical protein
MMHLLFSAPFAWASSGAWSSSPLVAYLDPGTGSYALQMLLAGLFGGLFALKQSWAAFKAWFASRRGTPMAMAGASAGLGGSGGQRSDVARPRLHGTSNTNE